MQETSVSVQKNVYLALCPLFLTVLGITKDALSSSSSSSAPTLLAVLLRAVAGAEGVVGATAPGAGGGRGAPCPLTTGGRAPLPQSPPPLLLPPPPLPRRGAGQGRVSSASAPAAAYLERAKPPLPTLPERGGIKGGEGEEGKSFTATPSLLRACGLGPVATCMDHRLAQAARLLALRIAPSCIFARGAAAARRAAHRFLARIVHHDTCTFHRVGHERLGNVLWRTIKVMVRTVRRNPPVRSKTRLQKSRNVHNNDSI
jgi:hypothetical protein